MFSVSKDWNPKQAQLREYLSKPDCFDKAIQLCLELHSMVHCSEISSGNQPTLLDEVWDGLTDTAFSTAPTNKDVTIAWSIWHITRIEDITANILINNAEQILNDDWLKRLNTDIRDTGNAMNYDEILSLSSDLNIDELRNYRNAVGARTKAIIESLSPADIKRKMKQESLDRILSEGGLTEQEDSVWLLDFWGKKSVAGILLMPITRHQIIHVNDSLKLRIKFEGKK